MNSDWQLRLKKYIDEANEEVRLSELNIEKANSNLFKNDTPQFSQYSLI